MEKHFSPQEIRKIIFPHGLSSTKGRGSELLLEQYKLVIEATNQVTERLEASNTFFITSHSLIISAWGFFIKDFNFTINMILPTSLLLFIGLIMSLSWDRVTNNYKRISKVNYLIIQALEGGMPSRPFIFKYQAESEKPKHTSAIVYTESLIPKLFSIVYIIGLIGMIYACYKLAWAWSVWSVKNAKAAEEQYLRGNAEAAGRLKARLKSNTPATPPPKQQEAEEAGKL